MAEKKKQAYFEVKIEKGSNHKKQTIWERGTNIPTFLDKFKLSFLRFPVGFSLILIETQALLWEIHPQYSHFSCNKTETKTLKYVTMLNPNNIENSPWKSSWWSHRHYHPEVGEWQYSSTQQIQRAWVLAFFLFLPLIFSSFLNTTSMVRLLLLCSI